MKPYCVTCYHKGNGKHIWSGTWQAQSAAHAIAQATLPVDERPHFLAKHIDANLDKFVVMHPLGSYIMEVSAERLDHRIGEGL